MGIGLVIGRAGSGKTRLCLDRIHALVRQQPLGPAIFWIVPRQITFTTERLLLEAVGPHCRVRVLSFDTLGEYVLGITGGLAKTHVSTRGRGMILGYLLRQLEDSLQFFKPSARRPGLAREIDRTLTEIERAGKSTADVVEAIEAAMQSDPSDADTASLVGKIADLHRLHEAYTQFLGPDRLDPQRKLAHVLAALCDCKDFRHASIFIDGFIDFTRHERQMIVGLAKSCVDVTVTLTMDPASPTLRDTHTLADEMSLFHRSESSTRRLRLELAEAKVEQRPIERLGKWKRAESKSLAAIESTAFSTDAVTAPFDPSAVHRMVAPDRAAEVDAVAREIRSLQRSGHRLRDMLVLCRDLEPYRALVQASFREHGISLFLDARRSAVHHPLIRWLRGVFEVAMNEGQTGTIIPLLRTGLIDVAAGDVDTLETAAIKLNASPQQWESTEAWPPRGFDSPEISIEADAARRKMLALFQPFFATLRAANPLTIRQIATAVFTLLEASGARKTLARWIANARDAERFEEAAEHEQVWSNVVDLFDEMVDLLGDHPATAGEFYETLQSGLESFDFALAPPTLDQISVGEIERLRASEASIVFVLGLSESIFPRAGSETTVLSDNDRGLLRRRSIELDDDTTRKLLDERLLGYLAFTRARNRLILSRPATSDKGQRLGASPFWRRLDELFPESASALIQAPCYSHDTPDCLDTPRQLITGLMRWARRGASASPIEEATWRSLYTAAARWNDPAHPIAQLRHQAWAALSYRNNATLSRALAAEMFAAPLVTHVGRIESFASCPFQHFARHGLKLRPRQAGGFTANTAGLAMHQVLDKLVARLLVQRRKWADLSDADAEVEINALAKEVTREFMDEAAPDAARQQHVLARIVHNLRQVVLTQRATEQVQRLRPKMTDATFGPGPGQLLRSPIIRTPAGREVQLRGKIDRIDEVPGTMLRAVTDYKSAAATLDFSAIYHGLAIQLLAFMLVLRENGAGEKRLTPIGALYQRVTRSLAPARFPQEPSDDAEDADDPSLRVKPRGILHLEHLAAFDQSLAPGGTSSVIAAGLKMNGELARASTSDALPPADIDRLLDHVRSKIAELCDALMDGDIRVFPYRIGTITPCSRCDFRSVCRFEPGINGYHTLDRLNRDAVLAKLGGDGDSSEAADG